MPASRLLERWGQRLAAVAAQFPENCDICPLGAKGTGNAIIDYAKAGHSHHPDLLRWRKVLGDIAWAFPTDLAIQAIARRHGLSYADQAAAREPRMERPLRHIPATTCG